MADFNKVIEMDPNNAVAHFQRAGIYAYKGDYDKAWEGIHKAQSLGHEIDPRVIENLKKISGREK